MPCVYPLDAWRAVKPNESGKFGITFNPREGYSDRPIQIPCGKCIGCNLSKQKEWSIRAFHESTLHAQNSFLTLTYSDPAPPNLDRTHLQLFFKRLRKQCKVRYFACGEYGESTRRPHYHAIIFGQDFLSNSFKLNDEFYSTPWVERTWGHGNISISQVNMATCCYVAGYVTKKQGDPDTFNLMSRRPGIGHGYAERYHDDMVRIGKCVVDGKELPIPKRYITWYESQFEQVIQDREQYMANLSPEQIWSRRTTLRGREINYNARSALKQEKL